MSTLEHPEVTTAFGKVVEEAKLLNVPAAEVPGYNAGAYDELTAAMGELK